MPPAPARTRSGGWVGNGGTKYVVEGANTTRSYLRRAGRRLLSRRLYAVFYTQEYSTARSDQVAMPLHRQHEHISKHASNSDHVTFCEIANVDGTFYCYQSINLLLRQKGSTINNKQNKKIYKN